MARGRIVLTMVLAVWFAGFCSHLAADTWYVDNDAPGDPDPNNPLSSDPAEDGSMDHPFDAIQEAINTSVNGDTVIILPGIYTGNGNRDITYGGRAITVQSISPEDPGIVAATVIDCEGNTSQHHRGFDFSIEGEDSILLGITITGGYADYGGGISISDWGNPTIAQCRFVENYCTNYGGGLYGNSIIRQCDFIRNEAVQVGGGMYIPEPPPQIDQCIFSENQADLGGGLFIAVPYTICFTNCLFHKNLATGSGGALRLHIVNAKELMILNCTFTDNQAGDEGGAIHSGNLGGAEIRIINSILWGDSAPVGPEILISNDSKVILEHSDVQEGPAGIYSNYADRIEWGSGNIDADPNFAGADDFRLTAVSACIDAGTNSVLESLPSTDLGEMKRWLDGDGDLISVLDMGAYEFPHPGSSPVIATIPEQIMYAACEGGTNPTNQTIAIWNGGTGALQWQINEDCSWLTVNPSSGSVAIGYEQVEVSVDVAGLTEGIYSYDVVVSDPSAANTPQIATIVFYVMASDVKMVPNEYATIQSAINASSNGDEVVIAPGRYTGTGNKEIIYGGRAITVRSVEPTNPSVVATTVIDCEESGRAFIFGGLGRDSILQGVTIQNGAEDMGGGIYCGWTSSPTIQYCIFKDNFASQIHGGAILILDNSNPLITDCIFENNIASQSGGAISNHYSTVTLERCFFLNNSTKGFNGYHGGAIYSNGHTTIRECMFRENVSTFHGGAVYNESSRSVIQGSRFEGNQALNGDGGGIYSAWGEIEGCSFVGNTALYGGGVADHSQFFGCTFVGNVAQSQGGAIWNTPGVSLIDCIVWGNADGSGTDTDSQIYNSLNSTANHSCIQDADPDDGLIPFGGTEQGNIDDDPQFVRNPDDGGDSWGVGDNDDYGDVHLRSDSPCIDAGIASLKGNFYGQDMDEQVRFTGMRSDMGADEFTPIVMVTNPQADDVWAAGSTREITWDAVGLAGNVDILYSTNNGTDWSLIEPNIPNSGSYDWQVPLLDSETCLVKLAAVTPPDYIIYHESGLFAIRTSLPGPPVASSWPTRGNNFQRTGLSDFSGPEIGCIKWQFATDSPIHQGVTSGGAGRVHVASEAGVLYTLNPNGVLAWSFDVGSEITNTPTVGADGTVYFGCADGNIWAVDKDGLVRWNHHAAGPVQSSAAIADDEKVFLGSTDGVVYALDPNGIELWQRSFDDEGTKAATFTASPTIGLDGSVYVGALYDPNLYALDPETGDIRWRCALSRWAGPELGMVTGSLFTEPVVAADGTIYVAPMHDTFLYAIDPAGGDILWSVNLLDVTLGMTTPSAADRIVGRYCWSKPAVGPEGEIYVSFDDIYQQALNPEETQSVYKEDTYLRAVNPNGTFAWTTRLGRGGNFSLSVGADGLVYATADDGSLYIVNADGQEVSRFDSSDWQRYPVSHWTFDQGSGTVAADSLGGKHGMLHNFPTDDSQWTAGKIGGALQFDGTDDYVRIEPAEPLSGQRSKRIRAWMQTSSDGVIYSESRTPDSTTQRWIWLISVSGGKPLVQILPPGMYLPVAGTTPVADGKWHLLEAVYKANAKIQGSQYFPPEEGFDEVTIYVDGKLEIQTQFLSYDYLIKRGENIIVGAHYNDSVYYGHFNGRLDDVQVSFDTDNTLHSAALGADGTLYVCDSDYRLWAIGQEDCSEEPLRLGRIADFNHDGIVNLLDYSDLGRSWQRNTDPHHLYERSEEAPYLLGDINRDLYIDFADLVALTRDWLRFD